MSAILSVFPKPRESVSLKKSCYVAASITSQSFPDFINLSESCQRKAVFVQSHNTSFHSKFRQTEVNTKRTRWHTNWHFTRIVYHWSLILRSFRAKPKLIEDDANGFVKALCQSLHLWILNPMFENQTLADAQKRDIVPLTYLKNLPVFTSSVWSRSEFFAVIFTHYKYYNCYLTYKSYYYSKATENRFL